MMMRRRGPMAVRMGPVLKARVAGARRQWKRHGGEANQQNPVPHRAPLAKRIDHRSAWLTKP
jgi:hypothetical protein